MLSKSVFKFLILLIVGCGVYSCKEQKRSNTTVNPINNQKAKVDTTFAKMLIVDSLGVTGADGVISFPLSNGNSVFMMGDSFLASVENQKRDPNCKMINNTFIEVNATGGKSFSKYHGSQHNPDALLKPNNGNPKEYYWPGHGFEYNGVLHVFMSRFKDREDVDENGWKFEYQGADYLTLEKDTYKVITQEDFQFANSNGVHYGHSLLNEKDYTYIYGTKSEVEKTGLHVARAVINENTNQLGQFQFFDGANWVSNEQESIKLKGIDKHVPEQFSVFKYKNKYVLVMQERGLHQGNIYSYIADSPTGPWQNQRLLYHTTEQENKKYKIITYNAMAHPQFIKDNKLLISYCVNSLDVLDIHAVDVDYYRPKFIRVDMSYILDN